jgi:hypothetical protein
LERSTLELPLKEAKRSKSIPRPSRKSVDKGKSNDKKRIKITSREHVSPPPEIKSNSAKLVVPDDDDDNKIIVYKGLSNENRYKSLQKKLDLIIDYLSINEKGKCLANELFKAYDFSEKMYTEFYKSLQPSTLLNYQFG